MNKPLTYEEFIELAKENYTTGGDCVYECWDKSAFDVYVEEFGAITRKEAFSIFNLYYVERKEVEATIW